MGQLRAWHASTGADAHTASWLRKFHRLILTFSRLSMADFADHLASIYGTRTALFLESHAPQSTERPSLASLDAPRADPPRSPPPLLGRSACSYLDLVDFIHRASAVLARKGIVKGERVILFTSNRVEMPLLAFACMRLGAIAIPVNPQYRSSEVEYIITHSRARTIVTDAHTRSYIPQGEEISALILNRIDLEPDTPAGFESLHDLLRDSGPVPAPVQLADEDPVGIFYTSGTTGHPKGAVLTNRGFLFHVKKSGRIGTLIPKRNIHAVLHALPLTHIMGFLVFLSFLCSGSPIVFHSTFQPPAVLEAIERYGVTIFVGVPAMYGLLLKETIGPAVLQTIRLFVSAADVLPAEWAEKIRQHAERRYFLFFRRKPMFAEVYGQVETTGITCIKLSLPFVNYDAGCVGRRMPGVEIKIVDSDGREVKKGEVGEVVVKGDNVLKGYWGMESGTEIFTSDGWFRTGDLARKGSLGFFYFVDREKDMIKCGGYSIFSPEVEHLLMQHPKVGEAAVFGIPHPVKKEIPVAAVIPKPGQSLAGEELVEWAREHMAPYKSPRRVFVVESLPRGATQKVQKKELKQRYAHVGSQVGDTGAETSPT